MRRILIEYAVLAVLSWIFLSIAGRYIGRILPGEPIVRIGFVAITNWLAPAAIAGYWYGGRTGQNISSGFAWRVSAATGALQSILVLMLLLLAVLISLGPLFRTIPYGVFFFSLATGFAVTTLATRLVFRWGVRFGARKAPSRIDPEVFD